MSNIQYRTPRSHLICKFLVCAWAVMPLASAFADIEPEAKAPQHVIAMNDEAGWDLNAELNHPDGLYNIGDKLELQFSSPAKDVYVHLFNVAPDGKVVLLWPNDYHKENKVTRTDKVQFPTPGSKVTFRAQMPSGKELLVLLATERPLNLRDTEESRKLAEFLDKAQAKRAVPLSGLRSFFVSQEKPQGWAGKAIEITTQLADKTPAQPQAKVYRSAKGGFSVQAAGEFNQTEQNNGIITHRCLVGTAEYLISHFNSPEPTAGQAAAVVQGVRDAQRKKHDGYIQSERTIEVAGGSGVELLIKRRTGNHDWVMLSRILHVGNRVYLVSVSDTEKSFCRSTVDDFLLSFQTLEQDSALPTK